MVPPDSLISALAGGAAPTSVTPGNPVSPGRLQGSEKTLLSNVPDTDGETEVQGGAGGLEVTGGPLTRNQNPHLAGAAGPVHHHLETLHQQRNPDCKQESEAASRLLSRGPHSVGCLRGQGGVNGICLTNFKDEEFPEVSPVPAPPHLAPVPFS